MREKSYPNIKKAIALGYQSEYDLAPKVTAKGMNDIANRIIKKARNHDIPIQKDETLVALLSTIEVGDTIPQELYEAVAEIFNFVYAINREYSFSHNKEEE